MKKQKEILDLITNFYLKSGDFNGCPFYEIKANITNDINTIIEDIKSLISNKLIGLITPDDDVNTHIIRTGFSPLDKQIENLNSIDDYHSCFYPLNKHLIKVIDKSEFNNEPFKLELALGSPQLSFKSFDLSILEMYRNDPRYYYETDDIGGKIIITDKFYESNTMKKSDKIILDRFGYSFNEEHHRAVGVFLRDLANLSSEHQLMWKMKELDNSYKLHPAFFKSQVLGSWDEGVSVFDAMLNEIYIINQLCDVIGWEKLFRNDFGEYGQDKPKLLTFLIRPTLKEFNDFIQVLDKILSENINKKFFIKDIDLESETIRKDGKIVVKEKGTIQLLDEWMRKKFRFKDVKEWQETIGILKKVRKQRQKPAHKIENDIFDQKYIVDQRDLVNEVYDVLLHIRKLFQLHPKSKNNKVEIPDWLENGNIYIY